MKVPDHKNENYNFPFSELFHILCKIAEIQTLDYNVFFIILDVWILMPALLTRY